MSAVDLSLIASLAGQRRGLVATRELLARGVSQDQVDVLVRTGYLRRTARRGVFHVGYVDPTRETTWARAVAMAGEGAALSHVAAAQLHGITRRSEPRVDVTVPAQRRRLAGVRLHRHRLGLPSLERTVVRGIPVTTRWQTVSDLASVVQPAELAWSIREAMFHEPISTRELIQIRDARFQRTGAPCIRDAVSLYLVGSCGADSYPEMLAIEYLTASGLQPTCINVPLQTSAGTVRPDLAWPEFGLAFELDGRQHDRHPDRRDDARRTELLRDAGYDLVRARAKDVLRDINSALRPLVDELISRRESGYVSRTGSG